MYDVRQHEELTFAAAVTPIPSFPQSEVQIYSFRVLREGKENRDLG
jgi:hypothetical protein